MDALAAFEDGFRAELAELWRRHPQLADVPGGEAEQLGRSGARSTVAPILWRQALGEVWDTAQVTEFLGVSRQALAQRIRSGSMLGLRGRGTTLFPSWQFDITKRAVRPIVAALVAEFRSVEGVEAWTIASWASTPQTDLRGHSPAELLAKDERAEYDVLAAAHHTAARLAQ
jgi:hypothetical protein